MNRITRYRALAVAAAVLPTLVVGATAASAATADCRTSKPNPSVVAERYAGADRYTTALCASYYGWLDHTDPDPAHQRWVADAVVLARGDAYPDALAGGPFAAQLEAPLLLTKPTTLLPAVRAEIQRVLAPGGVVYLLGGTGSLTDSVEQSILAMGYGTQRIWGTDRFETAVNIAGRMPDTDTFFFTTGMNFPDALSAGTAAAKRTMDAKYDDDPFTKPMPLLFTKDAVLPASTKLYAEQHQAGPGSECYVAGGAAEKAVEPMFDGRAVSFVGSDRYDTASQIADWPYIYDWANPGIGVGLADGMNFPDALSSTGLLASNGQPLLLTRPTALPTRTAAVLREHAGDVEAPAYLDVFGGTGVVSDPVMAAAQTAYTPGT